MLPGTICSGCENLGLSVTAGVIINRTQENAAGDNGTFVVTDTPLPSTAPEKKMVFVIVADREFGSKQEAAFFLSVHSCSHSIFLHGEIKTLGQT